RRDLEQNRRHAGAEAISLACIEHPCTQIVERLCLLQNAQARRVRRWPYDGEVACDRSESLDQPHVVLGSLDGIAVGSDIDTENTFRLLPRDQPRGDGGSA